MRAPHFVRRAAWRVVTGGVVCAVVVALGGLAGERLRFGAEIADARQRIAGDVQRQFSTLAARLDAAAAMVRDAPTLPAAVDTRETVAVGGVFDRVAAAERALSVPGSAISVHGPDAGLIAWAGRPQSLPPGRITGPAALFLAPSSTGLRLTRVVPVPDPAVPDRRIATIVAEAPLTRPPNLSATADFVLPTSIVPVQLRLTFEGAVGMQDESMLIRAPDGEPLAAIDVREDEIHAARERWRGRVIAVEAFVLCGVLLLLSGPLLDWRRGSRRVVTHVVLTLTILALLVAARLVAWWAVRWADLAQPALAAPDQERLLWGALASPLDFLFTVLIAGAIVALAASSFEQWRQSRRMAVTVIPDRGAAATATFVVVQIAAGLAVAALLAGYEEVLRTRLTLMPFDVLHFSLHPFDPARLAVAMGLVVWHAALLSFAVLVFRMAAAPWVVAGDRRWIRGLVPLLWGLPAALLLAGVMRTAAPTAVLPALLAVAVAMAAAWRLRRYRAVLEHASQAARLTALFVALAAPSLVLYPLLVDAADRARRQLVETRYAPEVINQRRNLQLLLDQATQQIDELQDLADLVMAVDPVTAGPAPYEMAFRVWERTVLEDQRVTSSIELHDATGSLVSRFALKLPHTGGPQIYQETTCRWETFEEVSPFFAEERRLLHAGRGICVDGPSGPETVGSIAVHVILDYSNLSFISAHSPYTALLRDEEPGEPAPREAIEFTVFGWSRRPLYISGSDTWALTEEVFERAFASRDPFWARVPRSDGTYEVYFLNDRGGIYALGYRLTSPFGHLIRLAELIVLGAATFVLLWAAGFLYGFIAARTPASGRELLREVRASFYRKLFLAFVAAAVVPVLTAALVTRAYIATWIQEGLEAEAAATAASASRVVEDVGVLGAGGTASEIAADDLVVWLSRVIAQDVNIFDQTGLVASSERSLFAYGLLPRSTQGDVYRAIMLEGRPTYVTREAVGTTEYLVAAAPVRLQNRQSILTVPLTLQQQQIEAQIDELDRRVLLAAVLFIILGAIIGYSMAERIADPVNRLMKATGRIARGDLSARILATSSDEFRRLVDAFNRMAADLERQRVELERSNRLAAAADMARQVAHDIKNPLTPVQLNAEHLRRVHDDRGRPLGPVLDDCVNTILQQVTLLRRIASEFSSFATSPTVTPSPSSIRELVDETVEPYRTGLKGRVSIEEDVPASLPFVMVDGKVLARALTNIIENALHAMPNGGTLRIAAQQLDGNALELAISDTGKGMDAEALSRIYEPYFSTRATGTGLGLTIAKRNVELNGGSIDVTSQPNKGTTVRITLPLAREAA